MFSYVKVHLLFESCKIDQIIFYIINVGMKGPNKDIGLWATPKDVKEPKHRQVLVKVSKLLSRGRGLVIINR